MILHGDSIEVLKTLDDCSVDAVVTDPPYGLGNTSPEIVAECLRAWSCGETWTPKGRGFMGKSWDAWVPPPELWREVLRVLKPGGHALVFAGSRTQDLMSISLRLAGFEVRDTLQWLYGSGFPKSQNISKALDKKKGTLKVVGQGRAGKNALGQDSGYNKTYNPHTYDITEPNSIEARQWEGWGTALKPAYEPVILIRKPLEGTVADNVLEHGTGAINIDACRVGDEARVNPRARNKVGGTSLGLSERGMPQDAQASACTGRWPANVILDDHVAEMLDDQVQSNVSRFFYCPKASKTERDAGLEGRKKQLTGSKNTAGGSMKTSSGNERTTTRANTHPTVKPLDLMRYLVRLITPPNGLILDPFTGSGSTLCAGVLEGFRVLGIERESEYVEIARARLAHWTHEAEGEETKIGEQLNLFAAPDKL
jgi:site-specific DNA-methyltransferase (adenine-specific)